MKTVEDIIKGKFKLRVLAIGDTGTGKTYLAATAPKTYFLNCEPGGMDTVLLNPQLRKNLVGWEELIPANPKDTKNMFIKLQNAIIEAKQLTQQGKVETLVLDNITYLSENRWIYINEYEPEYSSRTGNIDPLSMYGKLSRWLYQFVLMDILTFDGHVFISAHEQLESEEALDKKPDRSTPILPNILGGFRDRIGGMFSCVFYLSKVLKNGKYHYYVRTNKGNQRNAKSRYNLPEIIEDVSYAKIMEAIQTSLRKSANEEGGGK